MLGAGPVGADCGAPRVQEGQSAGAVYEAGVTVAVGQLEHELHEPHEEHPEEQLVQAGAHDVPHTGCKTTWRNVVYGLAHVVHVLQAPPAHGEHVEHAGAYEAHVEQPDEHVEQPDE